MKLYHGTHSETSPFTMYFTADINEARDFALGINDLGEYNPESFIYETEIADDAEISVEEDFLTFDALAYENEALEGYADIVYSPETGWYIVKSPAITLIERYYNNL